MSVYKEKVVINGKKVDKKVDGKQVWYIRTYVTFDGKRKQITKHNSKKWIGRSGFLEAQRIDNLLTTTNLYEKELKEKKSHNQLSQNKITFEQLFYEKIGYDKDHNNNSESTRLTYLFRVKTHVFPIMGNIEITKIDKKTYDKMINHLSNYSIKNGCNKGKKMSIRTINGVLMVIIATLEYGVKFYGLKENIFKKYGLIKKDKDKIYCDNSLELALNEQPLSVNDWEKITTTMEKLIQQEQSEEKLKLIKLSLLLTIEYILVMRVGEAQALKYKNFDFKKGTYILYEAWNHKLKKITPTKNRKSRTLFFPKQLCNMFYKLYVHDKQQDNYQEKDFVFGGKKPFSRSTIDRYRKKVLSMTEGVTYQTNHKLRHAGISNAIYYGVDCSAVSDMAGHNKEIMFNVYTQTLKSANEQLVKILDQVRIPNI